MCLRRFLLLARRMVAALAIVNVVTIRASEVIIIKVYVVILLSRVVAVSGF